MKVQTAASHPSTAMRGGATSRCLAGSRQTSDHSRFAFPAACAAAVLVLCIAYANHFRNSFHFDDSHAVESNLFLRDLRNIPRFFTDAKTFSSLPSNQSYRPLFTTTLAIDYAIGQLNPLVYHLDSFFWFVLQCVVLYFLFERLLGSAWLALLGASVYGLHTAVAETVNYIVARADILSSCFTVICVAVFAHGGRARRYHLEIVPAALAVLAKEQGAMAAPLLALYAGLFEQRRSLQELLRPKHLAAALRPALPAFAVCSALVIISIKMPEAWTPGGTSRLLYALTQPWVMLHYAVMFVLPIALTADTDWTVVNGATDPRVLAGVLFLAALFLAAFHTSRSARSRPIAFGLLWFFLVLLPTSSVVPLAEVTNDHRMFFPFVGLALATACAVGLIVERRLLLLRPIAVGACAALLALAIGVHLRNRVWHSEETLWKDVTEKSPENGRGWMNYGLALMGRGAYADARRCYEQALKLAPQYGYAYINLAILQSVTGDPDDAERNFRLGLLFAPGEPSFRFFFARWLDSVGRSSEAVSLLREALAMSPAQSAARQLLLQILARQHRWTEVADAARDALRIRSDDPTALALLQSAQANSANPEGADPAALVEHSLSLYRVRDFEGVIRACDDAIAIKPDYAEAHNNKCAALNELKRYREAAEACEAALRIRPDFELARNNLAVARQAGRTDLH